MTSVQLYVYDLSNGLAKSLSLPLTGKQIDGIWHTSVVFNNREIFYGQGILEVSPPGTTHHGRPLHMLDMGVTQIDNDTINEYLDSLRSHYTAEKYHLLEFNCNSFTGDVIGFLTGGSIPIWISNLPEEFLSTPFGASLRPQIDAMFRRGGSGTSTPTAGSLAQAAQSSGAAGTSPNPLLAAELLRAVAGSATTNGNSAAGLSTNGSTSSTARVSPVRKPSASASTSSPLQIITNPSSHSSLLQSHPCVITLFTAPETCPPCRVIHPIYEDLASEFGKHGKIGFAVVDLGAGRGQEVAGVYGVRVTPTFVFFKDGKKVDELKGASKVQLRSAVEGHIDLCYPPHPHRRKYFQAISSISPNPIFSNQAPNYTALLNKFKSFIPTPATPATTQALTILTNTVIPRLELIGSGKSTPLSEPALQSLLLAWTKATEVLLDVVTPAQSFPLIDLFRIGVQDIQISTWLMIGLTSLSTPGQDHVLLRMISLGRASLESGGANEAASRPLTLTTLKLLQALFVHLPLGQSVLGPSSPLKNDIKTIYIEALLSEDASIRSAAAGLGFDLVGLRHRQAKANQKARGGNVVEEEDGEVAVDEEWESELLSAELESIGREQDEEVVYRLVATLALQLYLSSAFTESLQPLVEALEGKETLLSKLKPNGCGPKGVTKPEAKKLIYEVTEKLL